MPIPLGFFAAAGAVAGGSYDLLETTILSSNAASVTFSNLNNYAADYQHLQIRAVVKGSLGTFYSGWRTRLNVITATNSCR